MKNLFLFFIFIFISLSSFGHTIIGVVKDKDTKETLVGANVIINNGVGSSTNLDGEFIINNVDDGTYNMIVSFISYESFKKTIVIHKDTFLIIELESLKYNLSEVSIRDVKRNNTDISTVSSIKTSNVISTGISNQIISRTQDKDASDVVKRLSGISIIDNKYIIIRGLNERYNNVLLDDIVPPSFDSDKKVFSFDVVPSNIINNIIITKTFSPELPADFAGGNIRITTMYLNDENEIKINFGTSYRTNTTFSNFDYYKGGNIDFLGIDDGIRKMPRGIPNNLKEYYQFDDNYNENQNKLIEISKKFNNDWNIYHKKSYPDIKFGLDISRNYKFKNLKLYNITSFNYSNGLQYLSIERKNYQVFNFIDNKSILDFDFLDKRYDNTIKTSLLNNLTLIKNKYKIEFKNFLNNNTLIRTTERQGIEYYSGQDIKSYEYKLSRRTLYFSSINYKRDKLDFTIGYSFTNKNDPDIRRLTAIKNTIDTESPFFDQYGLALGYSASPKYAGRVYMNLNENILSSKINYTKKFNKIELKTGFSVEYKNRKFDTRLLGYIQSGDKFDINLYDNFNNIFNNDNINLTNGLKLDETTNMSDSYNAYNFQKALYFIINYNIEKLNIYLGVRYESNIKNLNSYESNGLIPININKKSINIFPSINTTYKINSNNLIRTSISRTINRPEFRELAPLVFYDFDYNASFSGNPDLKNSFINNFDIRYDKYFNALDYLTIGTFYKNFSNPIEIKYINSGSGLQYGFQNVERSYCYGIELEGRKMIINNIFSIFNITLIKSEIIFNENSFEYNRPLQGQSPYIINTGFYYEYKKIKSSLLYNIYGKRIIAVGQRMQNQQEDIPDVYEMPFNSLDFNIQLISNEIVYKAGIQNILNSEFKYNQILNIKENKIKQENLKYKPGLMFNISVSFKI